VPTFAKQGYPQVNLLASVAFLAPKGVSEASAKILTEAIRKTLQESKLQENLKSRGYNVDLRTTTDLNKFVKESRKSRGMRALSHDTLVGGRSSYGRITGGNNSQLRPDLQWPPNPFLLPLKLNSFPPFSPL
jgi:hypothetical protein